MAREHTIEIHTSDRQLFKRCRRKFGWASTLRDNLVFDGTEQINFFIGTGFHFALEDWWGYRRFAHPALAFAAYYDAHKADELPDDAEATLDLVPGMLQYYIEDWLKEHPEPYETLWVPDEAGVSRPQVEVEVAIPLNELLLEEVERRCQASGEVYPGRYAKVVEIINSHTIVYVTTYDRVVIDRHERLAGLDYKTAGKFDELNLQTNPQAGSYDWSLDLFYTPAGFVVKGIYWHQFKKAVPVEPRRVNVGKKNEGFSLDSSQPTTYSLYRKAVMRHYGTIPEKYHNMLAMLGNVQDDRGDQFIRLDLLRRNEYQREVEQGKIIAETLEMLDPDLVMYPNPTKDCSWDCPFKAPCLAIDDGSDFEYILNEEYTQWAGYKDDWRKRLRWPESEPTILTPA